MPSEPALVTVLVPTFEAAAHVEQTLASIAVQTEPRWTVLVADDASSDGTVDVALEWARRDPRFRVHRHSDRLGWVENLNWLLDHVDTAYFCFLPHDDVLEPQYLERLLQVLSDRPHAVCAFSDLERYGTAQGVIVQDSITGEVAERFATLLRDHYPAVAFRGVTRTDPVRAGARLRHNRYEDRFCDTVWMAELLAHGELVRVPELLYRKRFGPTSVHAGWLDGDPRLAAAAWVDHSVQILGIALRCEVTPEQTRELTQATLARSLGLVTAAYGVRPALSAVGQSWLLALFLSGVAEAGLTAATQPWPDAAAGEPAFALHTDLAEARRDRDARAAELRQARRNAADLRDGVQQRTADVERLRDVVGELRRELHVVSTSKSWRITRPLRAGAARVRGAPAGTSAGRSLS